MPSLASSVISDAVDAMRDAGVNDVVGKADGGEVRIYSGTAPGVGEAATGTLLATIALQSPAFSTSSDGSGQATAQGLPLSATAAEDGTAGYVRVLDDTDAVLWEDGDVGTSGNNVTFDDVGIEEGGTVTITAWTFTQAVTT